MWLHLSCCVCECLLQSGGCLLPLQFGLVLLISAIRQICDATSAPCLIPYICNNQQHQHHAPCIVICRLEALRWIHFLLIRNEDEVFGQLATLLAALLDALGATSERVVLQALSVLGAIAGHQQHFRRVLMSLLDR